MIHRRLRRSLLALPCSLAVLVAGGLSDRATPSLSSVALANDKADIAVIKAQARTLFDEAMKLASKGRYQEAYPKFMESQRLDPGIGTKFYLADCVEHLDRYASAWALYMEVADEADEAKMKERSEYAKKRADALLPKLTRMIIVLSDDVKTIPGIEVRRDGVVVAAGQWGTPVPVDAGKHTVSVGAPSKRSWETTVEASGEGAVITVTIPALREDGAAVPAPTASASAAPSVAPTAAPTSGAAAGSATAGAEGGGDAPWPAQKKIAIATGAVGVAGLAVGAILGGLAVGKKGEMDGQCTAGDPPACNPAGVAIASDVKAFGTAGTIGLIAGGALAVGGVVLWLTAPSASPPGPKTTGRGGGSVRVGVGAGGLVVKGAF